MVGGRDVLDAMLKRVCAGSSRDSGKCKTPGP